MDNPAKIQKALPLSQDPPSLTWKITWIGCGLLACLILTWASWSIWSGSPATYHAKDAGAPFLDAPGFWDVVLGKKLNAPESSIYSNGRVALATFALGWVAVVYACYGIFTFICYTPTFFESTVHLTVFTLGPPTFFFVEWFILFPRYGVHTAEAVASLRDGEAVARNLWAGFGVLFGLLHVEIAKRRRGQSV